MRTPKRAEDIHVEEVEDDLSCALESQMMSMFAWIGLL